MIVTITTSHTDPGWVNVAADLDGVTGHGCAKTANEATAAALRMLADRLDVEPSGRPLVEVLEPPEGWAGETRRVASLWRAHGQRAGLQGVELADNPYRGVDATAAAEWAHGHAEGQAEVVLVFFGPSAISGASPHPRCRRPNCEEAEFPYVSQCMMCARLRAEAI